MWCVCVARCIGVGVGVVEYRTERKYNVCVYTVYTIASMHDPCTDVSTERKVECDLLSVDE